MNIGIRLHDTAPGTLAQRLGFARAQGFSCAHLALSKVVDGFSMTDAPARLNADMAAEVREAFDSQEMTCAVLGCYLNLADPDGEQRLRTREIYGAHLHFASMIGARVVGTETFANPASRFECPAPRSEEAFRFFVDCLRSVAQRAEEENAILAVEPVWNHIISTPERAERMLDAVSSDHVQIILDAVNLIGPDTVETRDEIIADAIRRLGDRVRILHMKDLVTEDGKVRSVACGTGMMRYEQLLAFAARQDLPMTLEDTKPHNAEAARLYLERVASEHALI